MLERLSAVTVAEYLQGLGIVPALPTPAVAKLDRLGAAHRQVYPSRVEVVLEALYPVGAVHSEPQ